MATVEWQTTCTDLKQRGALLLETGEWTDCKLLVGPEAVPFRAHKLMLAMASPVFESIFFQDAAPEQDTFTIPDVKPKAFEALVNYIYTENITINSYKRAHRLYLAANKFQILQLARVCAEYMCCNVSMETACATYEAALKFQDHELMYESLQMIKLHIREILHHKSFEEADLDTVAAIFGVPDLKVEEIELYQALERYSKAHLSRKRSASPALNETGQETISRRSLRKALQNIRFLTFGLEEFAKGPAKSGLLARGEALRLLLNIAGEGEVPMPPGFTDVRQPRYLRPATPQPAPVTTRGVLSATLPADHAMRRSSYSARVDINRRQWLFVVLPYTESGTNNQTSRWLAVFLRCVDAAGGWACRVRAHVSLRAHGAGNQHKTCSIEETYTSTLTEQGVKRFIAEHELMDNSRGYVQDGVLTFEAIVTVVSSTTGGSSVS